jgi:hypothetical protein
MGQELECTMRWGGRSLAGKAYLETDYVLFRGEERVKVAFKDLSSVTAADGVLQLEFAGGPAELELGKAAAKWAEKILHPPTRADKLGVKAGTTVRLVGEFEADFLEELRARGATVSDGAGDLVVFAAGTQAERDLVKEIAAGMQSDGGLWVIYPRGVKAIREIEVIEAGRAAGLKDIKVASFSGTQTGLKFVVPVGNRVRAGTDGR